MSKKKTEAPKFADLTAEQKLELIAALLESSRQTCVNQNVIPCGIVVIDPDDMHSGGIISLNMSRKTLLPIILEAMQALMQGEGITAHFMVHDGAVTPIES